MRIDTSSLPAVCDAAHVRQLFGGISDPTLAKYIARGVLPKPMRPNRGRRIWPRDEIIAAIRRIEQAAELAPKHAR